LRDFLLPGSDHCLNFVQIVVSLDRTARML
jgi:hypothetical protein